MTELEPITVTGPAYRLAQNFLEQEDIKHNIIEAVSYIADNVFKNWENRCKINRISGDVIISYLVDNRKYTHHLSSKGRCLLISSTLREKTR